MSAARGRADAGEYARRVNAAAELLTSGAPLAEAARVLADRFGCSARQARRYVERAAQDGPTAVPETTTVFTVRLPAALAARVPGAGPARPAAPVSDRMVETRFVFDRHAATDLSVAYAILVPQRRARVLRAGQEGRPQHDQQHDQRGDLRPGVVGPAEEGRDDRVADRGAARARRTAGA